MNLIIGLGLFTILAIIRRDLALYLIILLLPSYQIRFQVFGVPATFLEGMILSLAVVELARHTLVSLRGTKRSNPITMRLLLRLKADRNDKLVLFFILFFLLAAFISVFTAPDLAKAAGIFKAYFFEAILFFFLTILIIDTPQKAHQLFKILALLVLYLSLFGIYQFITLYGLPFNWWAVNVASRRISSLLNHPNALALLLGPLLAMLIMLPQKTKLLWLSIVLGLIALYLSFSRAALLALAVTILGLGLLTTHRKKILLAVAAGVILILLVPFSRTKIFDLVKGRDLSQQNRYVLWSAAGDLIKQHPVKGLGLMGFHEAYKNYPLGPDRVIQNYPHNFFLNFWVETGLLGLISMIGLLVLFFKKILALIRNHAPFALAAAAGMAMVVLHSMVDVSYFKNDLAILFWLIYSLPFLSLREVSGS